MRRLEAAARCVVFVLGCLLWAGMAQAAPLEVHGADRLDANTASRLCIAPVDATLADVVAGRCLAQEGTANAPVRVSRGMDGRAFWLQLELHNGGSQTAERWLQVGHPRLEHTSLFLPDGQRLDAGIATPMKQREDVPRHYGVLPVTLPAGATQTVWLRVQSRTLLDIGVTVWSPSAFIESAGLEQLSLTLALGSLLAALLYAAVTFALTRELPYLFFALAMLGEITLEAFRAGMLQRYVWPASLPMPVEMAALTSMLSIIGFVAFFYYFVPMARKQRFAFPVYMALVVFTVLAQLWSVAVDYAQAVVLWNYSVYGILLLGLWILWFAWRQGFRPAGTLLLGFGLMLVPESMRVGAGLGLLPFLRMELLSGPWALVFIVPVLFAGLAQRSRELQAQLMASQAENRAKLHFLAHMSHELRTPLDTILGNAQLLARPANHSLLSEGLNHIQHSGRHLLGMIDGLLDYARGQGGKLVVQPEPVNLANFLSVLETDAHILAARNGNTFTLQSERLKVPGALLDEARLRQVLDNLLANAARHTHHSWIKLECASHSTGMLGDALRLEFELSDDGEGIALEEQEKIFLPFERGSHPRRKGDKGAGIGLAVARQLVEAMGGELSVKSRPGHGARFSFWITAKALKAQELPAGVSDLASVYRHYLGPRQRILVVDDNDEALEIIRVLLSDCGFEVTLAHSGFQAARLLPESKPFDLIVTDQFMDDGDGWLVLKQAARHCPQSPVVLISAAAPTRPPHADSQTHFAAYLPKPLDHAALLQLIGELLSLHWHIPEDGIEAPTPTPSQPSPLVAQQALPPVAELQKLHAMVEAGQVSGILRWAEALKTSNPSYAKFADQVHVAARVLDFAALRAAAQKRD
jgi:signal transduction histidine kinase/DNA-binding NarL/FixJ family response regulator